MRLGPIFKEIIQVMEKQVMANKVPMTKYEINMVMAGVVYSYAYFSRATIMQDRDTQTQYAKEVAEWVDKELPEFHNLFCEKCKEGKNGYGKG